MSDATVLRLRGYQVERLIELGATATPADGLAADPGGCCRCGGQMRQGVAMQSTLEGVSDFTDGAVVTVSEGGPGRIVRCMKCAACGWSVAAPRRAANNIDAPVGAGGAQ